MNRRTFDFLVPLVYLIALLVSVFVGNAEWVGITALVGVILVAVYFLVLRPSAKKVGH